MQTVVGIFTSHADAERAAERLGSKGIRKERINYLTPDASQAQLETVPTTETEQPGVAPVLGGVVGGATGISTGMLGVAVASTVIPGVGVVTAIGAAAVALLGIAGALAGAAVGDALEESLAQGLPKDELFVYQAALREGRTVLVALADDEPMADAAREVLIAAGAESIDAARQRWWIGLRDAEAETYSAQGGDFTKDELIYRRGFEAALRWTTAGKPYETVVDSFRTEYADVYQEEAFRRGYERGRAYYQGWASGPLKGQEGRMMTTIRDVMTPNPITLPIAASLIDAALAMRDADVGAVIVLDNGHICGIVTDRDIVVRALANGNYPATTTLGEICSRELATISSTDTPENAVRLMRQKAIRRLPVVENGRPVGIVSIGDLAVERDRQSVLGDISAAPANR
jgi:CBS domain-containing protein